MDKKQTAVEWLIESLPQIDWEHPHYGQLVQHAKQMEKEQMIDAHIEGQRVFDKHPHTQWTTDQAELYYNETHRIDDTIHRE